MEFNWEDFKDGKFAVHCKTKKESDDFIDKCYAESIRWHFDIISKYNYWNDYKQDTCYSYDNFNNYLIYANCNFYHKIKKRQIVEWSDYMDLEREKNMIKLRGTDSAKVISVIETKALRGQGTENDPYRTVIQYWNLDGKLLAENDGYLDSTDRLKRRE